jgi:hypothetical protein
MVMERTATKLRSTARLDRLLTDKEERLRVLNNIRGMWKNKKPDPLKAMEKIRKGWDRKLP